MGVAVLAAVCLLAGSQSGMATVTAAPRSAGPVRVKAPLPATAFGLNVASVSEFDRASAALGVKPAVVGIFRDWAHDPNFPTDVATAAAARGASLLIAWEPWDSWAGTNAQPAFRVDRITAGAYDPLIDRWAAGAKAFGRPVQIRYAPEMNGDWRPWSPGVNGTTAAGYVKAWRHVVARFRARGATNVKWVWNPYVEVGEATPMATLYPGANYVDATALDGYNWGSVREWGWQSYDDIFASSVVRLKSIAPTKPWLLAEIGCAPGVAKPAWVTDTFTRARTAGAASVLWFEFNKETDWRLSATAESAKAAAVVVSGSGWSLAGPVAAKR